MSKKKKKHHKKWKKKHKKNVFKKYKKELPFILGALLVLSYYFNFGFGLLLSLIVIYPTILILKKINRVNLRSDLSCWGLRFAGVFSIIIGFSLLWTTFIGYVFSWGNVVFSPFIVIGICFIIIGAFCEFRSLRRFPMIGIWQ